MQTQPTDASDQPPSRLLRVARGALFLNAAAASTAVIGMVTGLAAYGEHPLLARKVADRELAGVFIMVFVGLRLRQQPWLIALPLVFVALNLLDSVYEFAVNPVPANLGPLVPEAIFTAIYVVFFVSQRRAGSPAAT